MTTVKSVCVFCGSRRGKDPRHAEFAAEIGRLLAESGLTIVYGGGRAGTMGVLADAALGAGGTVIGVIPAFLNATEIHHEGVTELIETVDMHSRRIAMHKRCDAFIVLPGGIGTLEETAEVLSWFTLDLHAKPMILVDSRYWAPLMALLEHMDASGFSHRNLGEAIEVVDRPKSAIELVLRTGA